MDIYEVGKVCCNPQGEKMVFDIDHGGAMLIAHWPHPTDKEIEAYQSGPVEIKVVEQEGVIFVLAKFGDLSWVDAPFHKAFASHYDAAALTPTDPSVGMTLHMMLVDGATGVLQAHRLLAIPYEETLDFLYFASKQAETIDRIAHQEIVDTVYRYYTTLDLVKMAELWATEFRKEHRQ